MRSMNYGREEVVKGTTLAVGKAASLLQPQTRCVSLFKLVETLILPRFYVLHLSSLYNSQSDCYGGYCNHVTKTAREV